MIAYVLDTDICIYAMKNKPQIVRQKFEQYEGSMSISSITLMELMVGVEKSAYHKKALFALHTFIEGLTIFEFDTNASYHTAQIKAALEKAGTPIGAYDVMIAGHVRSLGLIVVTNNEREFRRVEGLRVENWSVTN